MHEISQNGAFREAVNVQDINLRIEIWDQKHWSTQGDDQSMGVANLGYFTVLQFLEGHIWGA